MSDEKARSFVAIMIAIALIALSIRLSIDFILKNIIAQNESNAQENLKLVSAAVENFAREHEGIFPSNLTVLTESVPAYIDRSYVVASHARGYAFSCQRLEASGYTCTSVPVSCGFTGTQSYTISTGGVLTAEPCG